MLLNDNAHVDPGGSRSPGRRVPRGYTLVVLSAVIMWMVAGAASTAPPAGRPAAPTAGPEDVPPIYALVYGETDTGARISAAHERLVSECMMRLGFRYEAAGRPGEPTEAADRPTPFGLETLVRPVSEATDSSFAEDPNRRDEAYVHALYGGPGDRVTARGARIAVSRPARGCVAEAEQRLLGSGRARWIQVRLLLFEAEEDSLRLLEQDHDFQAVTEYWRQCMRRAGLAWPDPLRLLDDLPPDTDIRTYPATRADISCKRETGYLTTAYARLSAVQQKRLDEDPSLVVDWTALLHRQDTAAREVLGSG